jgi:hypothetical protein
MILPESLRQGAGTGRGTEAFIVPVLRQDAAEFSPNQIVVIALLAGRGFGSRGRRRASAALLPLRNRPPELSARLVFIAAWRRNRLPIGMVAGMGCGGDLRPGGVRLGSTGPVPGRSALRRFGVAEQTRLCAGGSQAKADRQAQGGYQD